METHSSSILNSSLNKGMRNNVNNNIRQNIFNTKTLTIPEEKPDQQLSTKTIAHQSS